MFFFLLFYFISSFLEIMSKASGNPQRFYCGSFSLYIGSLLTVLHVILYAIVWEGAEWGGGEGRRVRPLSTCESSSDWN